MGFLLFVVFTVKQLGATKVIPPYPQVASLKVREDQMTTQRVPVDVSFSVGEDSGTRKITMVVTTENGENVECIGLADDMSDATEVRSADGESFETYRGSGGYLLQSSQSGIECRVHVRNSSGAPYTVADASDPPGFLSALIVFPSGHELDIERDTATNTYVSLSTKHLAVTRRMLQNANSRQADYTPFKCKQTRRRYLKIGVVVDKGYLSKYRGIKADAITGIRKLWAESSVPYETQFNIKLLASKILFPDDALLSRESWLGCGREMSDSFRGISQWRNTKQPDTFAAWYLVVGCELTPDAFGFVTAGKAWLSELTRRRTGFMTNWENGAWQRDYFGSSAASVDRRHPIAHEIGHLFAAQHTFSSSHGQRRGSHLGIMDYDVGNGIGENFLFESMHETEMCEILTLALSEKTRITQDIQLVDYNQRWGSEPTTVTTTTTFQRPTTKAPLPSTTPLQPTTETALPSTTPLQPTTETALPSTTPLQPTTETPLPSTTPLRPTTETPLPSTTLSPPLTATSTLGGDADKDVDSSSMLNTYAFIGIVCFLVLASIGCFCYIHRRVPPQLPANVNQTADSPNKQTVDSAKAKPSRNTRFRRQLEKTHEDSRRKPTRLKMYTKTKSGSDKQKSRE